MTDWILNNNVELTDLTLVADYFCDYQINSNPGKSGKREAIRGKSKFIRYLLSENFWTSIVFKMKIVLRAGKSFLSSLRREDMMLLFTVSP